ncbi:MAG: GNAT family N-acetyltransferase [Chlorobiaceae bacterium]|nr:GNAT family N-acetyltransferase [Chlorobiaceae bacterium]
MEPLVRAATFADIPACCALLGTLFNQEREFAADAQKQADGILMVIENPEKGMIFVCEIDDRVRGMVMLLFTVSTFLGKKVAILEDMIVSPDCRRKGIGALLLDTAIEYARSNGFGRITLLTDHDNKPAQLFYASKGFVKSEMMVYRKLIR